MREDDTKEIIQERFQIYKKDTEPVLDYYKKLNKYSKLEVKRGVKDAPLLKELMLE
jgi:adenylate kinase